VLVLIITTVGLHHSLKVISGFMKYNQLIHCWVTVTLF